MLILIAHGSRDPRWRRSVETLAEAMIREVGEGEVAVAYMQSAEPSLHTVATRAIAGGATRLRVLPLFMASAGHVEKDIQPLAGDLRRVFPEVRIDLLPPLGEQPRLPALLLDIFRETSQP